LPVGTCPWLFPLHDRGGSNIGSTALFRSFALPLCRRPDGARFWAPARPLLPAEAATTPLLLASVSPRRRWLLKRARLPFLVVDPGEDPAFPHLEDWPAAALRALHKAVRGACLVPGRLSLGADTIVVYAGHTLGKPSTAEEARAMLSLLSGRSHYVYTAFCLALNGRRRAAQTPDVQVLWLEIVRSQVRFHRLTSSQIEAYVAGGGPFDKAGGYGIQDRGHDLVESVRGSYYNVVGLPVRQVQAALRRLGWRGSAGG